jgi:hypothetical protein
MLLKPHAEFGATKIGRLDMARVMIKTVILTAAEAQDPMNQLFCPLNIYIPYRARKILSY